MSKPRPASKSKPSPLAGQPGPAKAAGDLTLLFTLVFGAFLGLTLLKFPNPPIMGDLVTPPTNFFEWLLMSWPVNIGYLLLGAVVLVGCFAGSFKTSVPKWLLVLPVIWLGWEFVASMNSVNGPMSMQTLRHFVACVACFYLGVYCLGRDATAVWFWGMLLLAFGYVMLAGFQQHFGGLAESRNYFLTYVYPNIPSVPPEYLAKIKSDRIFGTLFYPNSLAGAILLLLPVLLALIWRHFTRLTTGARLFLMAVVAAGALACLFWSGSKGGWLLMLGIAALALLISEVPRKWKIWFIAGLLVVGLAGFSLRYATYFQRKATSVSARKDYWEAAVKTAMARPVWGSGPGTFSTMYQQIKRPGSEMARLVHNDYLQQASDSGFPGFFAYTLLIVGVVFHGSPFQRRPKAIPALGQNGAGQSNGSNHQNGKAAPPMDLLRTAAWLGVLGFALQSLLEFGLYIPALAWCGFAMMGWLLATRPKPIDKAAAVV